MRFAWLKKNSADYITVEQSSTDRIINIAYNLIWWIPILLPFTRIIDYQTSFMILFVITIIRASANYYRNNILNPEQAERFPLRAP